MPMTPAESMRAAIALCLALGAAPAGASAFNRSVDNAGAIAVLLFILFTLLFPFFTSIFPIPEAEGLQVAFGDVEMAGGGGEPQPNPTPSPSPAPSPPVVENTDITTVDDKETDIVKPEDKKPTPPSPPTPNTNNNTNNNSNNSNTNSNPAVDPNSIFGGFGNNSGKGKEGDPTGKKELGGTGRGDQGNGDGKVGNRAIREKCTSVMNNTDWDEAGTAWVFICVDESGKVLEATFQAKTTRGDISSVTSTGQRSIAERCAKEYKYEPAAGQGTACGSIPVVFKKQ